MPTPTYTPLANITLGSSAASVTFSSISQAYRDLVLVVSGGTTDGSGGQVTFNSDTGSNYYKLRMSGDGTSASSFAWGASTDLQLGAYAIFNPGTITNTVMNIMDYSATDKHKTVLHRTNLASAGADAFAGRWASTSAITTIRLAVAGTTWSVGSTFALYGIAA